MLNQNLNPFDWRESFIRRGRLQIPALLQDEAAQALRDCLQKQVPWTLAWRQDERSQTVPRAEYAALDEAGRAALLQRALDESRGRYGFAYECYMMVKAYLDRLDPGLLLHPVLEYLNSPEFLGFARSITGMPAIMRVSAQATRYRAGHFLRVHNDFEPSEGRLAAYVINLTPRWESDWGGLLHFLAADGGVEESFFPHFNSISLFRVPQSHLVSGVMPYAEEDRLAITGWFQTLDA